MTQRHSRQMAFTLALGLSITLSATAADWPQWRGPNGDGVSPEAGLPFQWSEQSNIVWKTPLPDGASTPAIWGDAIFLSAQEGESLKLLRISKKTGEIEWTQEVGRGTPRRGPLRAKAKSERREQKFHDLHNMASPSPVTDGELVIGHFGNGDLAAYDFAGKQLWLRNLQKEHGTYSIWWGHANSPVLYKDSVITVCMQDNLADLGSDKAYSYLIAHDKRTGAEKWKTMRMTEAKAEECDSYTTPIFRQSGGRTEMIVMGGNQIDAYDPATGRQLWYLPGIVGLRTITGPTMGQGLIYSTIGMRGPLLAIRAAGDGKLSPDAIVWKQTQGTPDTPCPVLWKDWLFWINDNGIAHCADAQSGELKWKERLGGDCKASPIAADGRVYFLNLRGKCTVVAAGPKFEKLAENQLDADTIASPAVSDGRLYLRSRKALYCIGSK